MLALMHVSTVGSVGSPRRQESESAIIPKPRFTWRRFLDALMTALSGLPV
ncbi:MAG TPA: hypothetical protein VKE98_21040 [Gemmataceae bacterium]|nr:hypothetical protein [Gemmataceae bacterium]